MFDICLSIVWIFNLWANSLKTFSNRAFHLIIILSRNLVDYGSRKPITNYANIPTAYSNTRSILYRLPISEQNPKQRKLVFPTMFDFACMSTTLAQRTRVSVLNMLLHILITNIYIYISYMWLRTHHYIFHIYI